MHTRSRHSGFSLLEAMFALVILSLAMVGVLQTIHAGQAQTTESLHGMRALHLAGTLMEQILSTPYAQATDYHGFSEDAGAQTDAAGALFDEPYQAFSRSATCTAHSMTISSFVDPIPGLLVVVTVEDARGQAWQLSRFIAEPAS